MLEAIFYKNNVKTRMFFTYLKIVFVALFSVLLLENTCFYVFLYHSGTFLEPFWEIFWETFWNSVKTRTFLINLIIVLMFWWDVLWRKRMPKHNGYLHLPISAASIWCWRIMGTPLVGEPHGFIRWTTSNVAFHWPLGLLGGRTSRAYRGGGHRLMSYPHWSHWLNATT